MTLPDEWYHDEIDLPAVPLDELIAEIDSHMPRDSHFSGNENLCALWDEYKRRITPLEAEVRDLRDAFDYEARVVEAQTLDLAPKSIGKGRRKILEEQVARMRQIADGNDRPMRHARDGHGSRARRFS